MGTLGIHTIQYSHTVAQVAEGSCSDLSLPLQKGSTSQLKEEATALSSPSKDPNHRQAGDFCRLLLALPVGGFTGTATFLFDAVLRT